MLGIGISLKALRSSVSSAAFNPVSLFSSGEEGGLYLPGPTTSFASPTNLTPCWAGDTVGFQLDTSQGAGYSGGAFTGLGSELVEDGGFDVGTVPAGWAINSANGELSIVDGKLQAQDTGGNAYIADYELSGLVIGNTYKVEYTDSTPNGIGLSSARGTLNDNINLFFSGGPNTAVFVATHTTMYFFLRRNSGAPETLDDFSVRELPGNHATQGTAAARPVLARVPSGGRRNLLEYTEEFDNAYWSKGDVTVTPNAIAAPDGTMTADRIVDTTAVNAARFVGVASDLTFVSGRQYTLSGHFKAGELQHVRLLFGASLTGGSTAVWFDVGSGTVGTILGGGLIDDYGIESLGDGWYRCYYTVTSVLDGSTPTNYLVSIADNDSSYTGDGTSGIYIWGAQLEVAA